MSGSNNFHGENVQFFEQSSKGWLEMRGVTFGSELGTGAGVWNAKVDVTKLCQSIKLLVQSYMEVAKVEGEIQQPVVDKSSAGIELGEDILRAIVVHFIRHSGHNVVVIPSFPDLEYVDNFGLEAVELDAVMVGSKTVKMMMLRLNGREG